MKVRTVFLIFLLSHLQACAGFNSSTKIPERRLTYAYIDVSGQWTLSREFKTIQKKLVTRTIINTHSGSKPLEKSVVVSQIGSVKGSKGRTGVVRPFASDYSVWLEGKEYSTKLRLDSASRAMMVDLNSPESKWQGKSSVPFPKGKYFCFYSQLSECLIVNNLLGRAKDNKGRSLSFVIVWDGFPYIQEQLNGVGSSLFAPAKVLFDETKKGVDQYQVEVDGQTLLYQFSKGNELVRMFWITQGISMVPPGEEVQQDEVE